MRLLVEFGVDPLLLAKSESWVVAGRGGSPLEMVAGRSFMKFQQDVANNVGTKMFMAMNDKWELNMILDGFHYWRGKSE